MKKSFNYENRDYSLAFDASAWNHDATNNVFWQIGVVYCTNPAATEYESLGIYVPGAYMTGVANVDGTYTCTINTSGTVNGYGAETAPIVIPINTPGYSAQSAPTSYSYNSISSYIEDGFVYVHAGCRGRENGYDSDGNLIYSGGAPWGVTDLKAAVRYVRYNDSVLPGNTDRIFTFGHSGGGAQSSLMGATGDSDLYFEYLESIGAAMSNDNGNDISDAIYGAMCWCPITSLDLANEAYEWMMGQFATTGTRAEGTWTSVFSDDMSEAFVEYINAVRLVDSSGTSLTLSGSDSGIYLSGSYYDYLLSEIERSLNNFLSDTEFPYTSGSSGPGPGGGDSVTYETVQEYMDSLNADEVWAVYDENTNTATITSVEAFVINIKNASKAVGAFDDLNRGQAENILFGDDENNALHFDSIMARLLEEDQEKYAAYLNWNESYVEAYQEYKTSEDALGNGSLHRQAMYNPMYYLCNYYEGYKASTVAPYWRIHTGITQGDTATTVEMNLALALGQYSGVESVEFETVWAQGHTQAERTGDSTGNFINWVNVSVEAGTESDVSWVIRTNDPDVEQRILENSAYVVNGHDTVDPSDDTVTDRRAADEQGTSTYTSSSENGASAIYVTNMASTEFTDITVNGHGTMSNADLADELASKYGYASAVLVNNGGTLTLNNPVIVCDPSSYANGAYASDTGSTLYIHGGTINTDNRLGHGIDATYGGTIYAEDIYIHTRGSNSGAIATDFQGGYITVANSEIVSEAAGSPGIYTAGASVITVRNSSVTANGTEGVMIAHDGGYTYLHDTDVTGVVGLNSHNSMVDAYSYLSMEGGRLTSTAGALIAVEGGRGNMTLDNVDITIAEGHDFIGAGQGSLIVNANNVGTVMGDVTMESTTYLELNLANSTLEGAVHADKLTLANATWVVTGTSYLGELMVDEDSKIVGALGGTIVIMVNGEAMSAEKVKESRTVASEVIVLEQN